MPVELLLAWPSVRAKRAFFGCGSCLFLRFCKAIGLHYIKHAMSYIVVIQHIEHKTSHKRAPDKFTPLTI